MPKVSHDELLRALDDEPPPPEFHEDTDGMGWCTEHAGMGRCHFCQYCQHMSCFCTCMDPPMSGEP